ncbi:hypothetical protein OCU04_010475 [Sclerotinia nivalis]|uniref:Uncharacterized protein n=1 Tax=Sclerotinia nivalis TaxID=352851 RepID=A0A9X0DGQ6_9HELO|nr:hypothetical protein OCU04_010475 [Sclerotinia nivalis]
MLSTLLFRFATTFLMVDTLMELPSSTISQIRKIRVRGYSFPLFTEIKRPGARVWDDESSTIYQMAHTLSLFPGLQLDKLIVEDVYHDKGQYRGFFGDVQTYDEIGSLVHQNGWKELWYLTPTTEFIETGHYSSHRVEQPAGWDKDIKEMDGVDAGAECKVYVGQYYEEDEGKEEEECDEGTQDGEDYESEDVQDEDEQSKVALCEEKEEGEGEKDGNDEQDDDGQDGDEEEGDDSVGEGGEG